MYQLDILSGPLAGTYSGTTEAEVFDVIAPSVNFEAGNLDEVFTGLKVRGLTVYLTVLPDQAPV